MESQKIPILLNCIAASPWRDLILRRHGAFRDRL